MTKKVRNSDRPTSTWFGGEEAVPSALRSRPSTMTMRVKPVIISMAAGRNDSEVSRTSVWIESDQVWPPPAAGLLVTPGSAWARADSGRADSASPTATGSSASQMAGAREPRAECRPMAARNVFIS
ncbi:hypothetical protein D3C81_998320 [compost metagenome]